MFSFLTKRLDQWVIRTAAARFQPPRDVPVRVKEAEQLLQGQDFFSDFAQAPATLTFNSRRNFEFPSPISTPWPQNNKVVGRFYRAGREWQKKPSVVLLHGWNGEGAYQYLFPWVGSRLAWAGINALMFELPYHGRRKPPAPRALRNFISPDVYHTIEATRQTIAETRSLLGWALAQGSPQVGLWGISMGAWLAGLVAAHDPRARFAVLMAPMVNLERAVQELPFAQSIRESLEGTGLRMAPLNLISFKPLVPREQMLFIECLHDQFVPVETIEDAWRAWKQPEIWRLRHGHISMLLSPPVMERTVRWIARKTRSARDLLSES